MNRLNLGIVVSFIVIMAVTSLNFNPQINVAINCKSGVICSQPDCCNKVSKACSQSCTKPCCKKNFVKACGANCIKPCCTNKVNKQCASNCIKPCCKKP